MNTRKQCRLAVTLVGFCVQFDAFAADAPAMSASGSLFKMLIGLAAVLAVMALITWVLKRMLPGAAGQQSVVRIVGGVSVSSRERVVVVEIGNRWLVVGVAPGHVSAIADLSKDELGSAGMDVNLLQGAAQHKSGVAYSPVASSFAGWLKQASGKFSKSQ